MGASPPAQSVIQTGRWTNTITRYTIATRAQGNHRSKHVRTRRDIKYEYSVRRIESQTSLALIASMNVHAKYRDLRENISGLFTNEFFESASCRKRKWRLLPINNEIIMDPTIYKLINGSLLVTDHKFRRLPIKSLTNDGARSSLPLLCSAWLMRANDTDVRRRNGF